MVPTATCIVLVPHALESLTLHASSFWTNCSYSEGLVAFNCQLSTQVLVLCEGAEDQCIELLWPESLTNVADLRFVWFILLGFVDDGLIIDR